MSQTFLTRRRLVAAGATAALLSTVPTAQAELRITIAGVGSNQFPIAVKPFTGAESCPVDVAQVIRDDLARTGGFQLIDPGMSEPLETLQQPANLTQWAKDGVNALVVGAITPLGNDRWDVRYFLHETGTGALLDSSQSQMDTASLRMGAHRIADRIYTQLTGNGPMFASNLLYVAQRNPHLYQLVISDSDGANQRVAFQSAKPIISPTWSPDRNTVAYVSFENDKPVVFLQRLATGQRFAVSKFEGNNSAPAFSPDGRWLAVALSKGGRTRIWTMAIDGSQARPFTNSFAIDTEPTFSPDGQYIYFTSDRGGTPQIYRKPVAGGNAERVTFGTTYAVSPEVSQDNRYLTFVTKTDDGKMRSAIMELATGQVIPVTQSDRDESPSFAPNGRFIVFATQEGGRGVLAMASVDGHLTTRLEGDGDIREPQWGPVLK